MTNPAFEAHVQQRIANRFQPARGRTEDTPILSFTQVLDINGPDEDPEVLEAVIAERYRRIEERLNES